MCHVQRVPNLPPAGGCRRTAEVDRSQAEGYSIGEGPVDLMILLGFCVNFHQKLFHQLQLLMISINN